MKTLLYLLCCLAVFCLTILAAASFAAYSIFWLIWQFCTWNLQILFRN